MWREEYNWCDILEALTKVVEDNLKRVRNEDMIEFCFSLKNLRNYAENFSYHCNLAAFTKNSEFAERSKEQGNEKYMKNDYSNSLEYYTKSILYGRKTDKCIPLAFSNRSLVLEQMGLIPECLQDIDMALSTGYPKSKQEKLLLRKAKCLIQMGEIDKAQEILKGIKKKSDEMSKIIKEEVKKFSNPRSTSEYSLPDPAGGKNENFVSASKHVSVVYNEKKGRHVIATHDIQMGDVLFVEKPFAFIVYKEACHRCFKDVIAPIPCWNCSKVIYCSPKCRDEFWNLVHSFECGYHKLLTSVGIAYLSLKIILSASSSFSELKEVLSHLEQPKYEEGNVSFKSNGYDSVYHLVHHIEKHKTKDLFQYAMSALLLAFHLKNNTNFFGDNSKNEENLKLLTTIIWRHTLQLICNGHAITEILFRGVDAEVYTETENRVGTAIYPSASMMNHSCEPSIINCFYKNYLIVRASKDIRKGEEVFNCYEPHARRMNRERRQEILRDQYFFKCECQACLRPYDVQEIFTSFKCEDCMGPSVPEKENSECLICLNCGKKTSHVSSELMRKRDLFYSLMEEGKFLNEKSPFSSFQKFLTSWFVGRQIFYKFHIDLCKAANEAAKYLFFLSKYKICLKFLKCCLFSLEQRFGVFSIELAYEMHKTGDIVNWAARFLPSELDRELVELGVVCYQRAEKIIRLLLGPHHPDLEKIQKEKEKLEHFRSEVS